jgi:uncharacterized metal-binding protein
MDKDSNTVLVIPCSGMGKVHGLLSRETMYALTREHAVDKTDTVCLALLVSGDEETTSKVKNSKCITIDGCPKLCSQKNVELAGGEIIKSIRMADSFRNHRGAQPGTANALTEEGWTIVEEAAQDLTGFIANTCGYEEEQ